MQTLFPNCTIDLENGVVSSSKSGNRTKSKAGYYSCKLFDTYGNRYYYIHEIILAEGLQLPKHIWPTDEKGKRYVCDHILPVSNGGTDSFDNLRLIPEADNHRNPTSKKNNSNSKIGKRYSPSTEFKPGHEPWNKGKNYHTGKKHPHTEETKKYLSEFMKKQPPHAHKSVDQIDMKTGEVVKTWYSVAEIARTLGFSSFILYSCCKSKRDNAFGYIWRCF